MSTKLRIQKNIGAGVFNKFSITIIRLLQVPLFLHYLGVDDFGRWTVLYTLPAWLSFTNFGFGSVATSEMTMNVAKGAIDETRRIFSTTLMVISLITLFGILICFIVGPFINWDLLLKSPIQRHSEFYFTVFWLVVSVFLSFYFEVFGGVLRASQNTHITIIYNSLLPWLNLIAIFISFQISRRFDILAFSMFLSNLVFLLVYVYISRRYMPQIWFSIKNVQKAKFNFLLKKGFAYQAFPIGNAIVIQGNIIIVQGLLGPASVALFGTVRTLVKTIIQALDIINQATWPELSQLIGIGNYEKASVIHRSAVAISIILSLIGILGLAFGGNFIYGLWVGNTLDLPTHLLLLFLLPLPFNAIWLTSSVVHIASNNHEGLAIRYIFSAIIASFACIGLTYIFGIEGAAVSTIFADILLVPYVIKKSMDLTRDNWQNFKIQTYTNIYQLPKLFIQKLWIKIF